MSEIDGTAKTQAHYQGKTLEPIEIIQEYLSKEELIGYIKGNVIKYTLRYGKKDAVSKEADKIAQYGYWLKVIESGVKINPKE